jgi:hypothetical protein
MSAIAGAFWTQSFLKTSGAPYAGCRVFHYAAGTSTDLNVWTDAALTTPAAQPVVGDNSGRVSFYASGTYRLLIKSSVADGDLTLYDFDGVELTHHTATLRAEDRGTSNPSITAAHRGRLFAIVDGGGDVTGLRIVKTASTLSSLITLPQLSETIEFAKGADLASSTNVTLGSDGNFFDITGTTNIESFSSKQAGTVIWTRFTGAGLTIIHNATSMILPNAMNYRTQLNEVCAWISLGSGNWMWLESSHGRFILGEDARTTTVAVPLTIGVMTTGTPAAGIGTGIRFDAESADEVPSQFGQLEFSATDPSPGTEDTYCQIRLRVAGAPLARAYRFDAGSAFLGQFTHVNTADRQYVLPDQSTNLVGMDTTQLLTNKSLASAPSTPVARVLYEDSIVKGWAVFDIAGVLDDDLNVSSITDNGSGDWTVNWATPFANANYMIHGSIQVGDDTDTVAAETFTIDPDVNPTTTAVRVNTRKVLSGGHSDPQSGTRKRIYVMAIGNN